MKKIMLMFVLVMAGGCPLNADVVKACGEACKDHGGVKFVTGEHCQCENW